MKTKLKKNDQVIVIAGRDKGKKGRILKLFLDKGKAIVEGVHFVKRHQKPTKSDQKGGIIQKESFIHSSNLMHVCSNCGKPTKIGKKTFESSENIRICKKCNVPLDR